jgi:hypothetical protein
MSRVLAVGLVPLRIQVECMGKVGGLDGKLFSIAFRMYDNNRVLAWYRWIGGIFHRARGSHYRLFWVDSDVGHPLQLVVYDGLLPPNGAEGMVVGGVIPEGVDFIFFGEWTPAHLFFERVDC